MLIFLVYKSKDRIQSTRSAPAAQTFGSKTKLQSNLGGMMNNKSSGLRTSAAQQAWLLVTVLALLFAGVGSAPAANAPSQSTPSAAAASPTAAAADTEELAEVVVTGTRIRGVAPVGSALITLDTQTMQQDSGLVTANDLLLSQPAVLNLGAGNNNGGGFNLNTAFSNSNSPNIHGLGTQATLSLVNGHRVWGSGTLSDVFDPNGYNSSMFSRVEVVADGTSAAYGADAISGTVNYILRAPDNIFETQFSGIGSKGRNYWHAGAIFGRTWNDDGPRSGGLIVSYQTSSEGPLAASQYPDLYNNDFSPYGGAPWTTFTSPGNILIGS